MASKFILIPKNGVITHVAIKPPQAPRRTLAAWHSRCLAAARSWGAAHYAFRHSGKWHVFATAGDTPIKSFAGDQQDAAEMYMMARK
jgi:hypothetical protein